LTWIRSRHEALKNKMKRLRRQIESASSQNPSKRDQNESDLVKSLDAFVREYKTQGRSQDAHNSKALRWNIATFWAVFVYTLITVGIFIVSHDANVMNLESGRAWLGTKSASIKQPIIRGQGLKVFIQYINTGKEPAKETDGVGLVQFFSQKDWSNGVAFEKLHMLEKQCLKKRESTVRGISFPTSGDNAYGINIDSNDEDIPEKSRLVATDEVISGKAVVAVSGCFVYETAGYIRHTAFCYNYQANRVSASAWVYCPAGNDAD